MARSRRCFESDSGRAYLDPCLMKRQLQAPPGRNPTRDNQVEARRKRVRALEIPEAVFLAVGRPSYAFANPSNRVVTSTGRLPWRLIELKILATISILLAIAVTALWVHSYLSSDYFHGELKDGGYLVASVAGRVEFRW